MLQRACRYCFSHSFASPITPMLSNALAMTATLFVPNSRIFIKSYGM